MCEAVGLDVVAFLSNTLAHSNGVDWDIDYSQYPAIIAVDYYDEPSANAYSKLAEWALLHNEKYGADAPFYWINLLPCDAYSLMGTKTNEEGKTVRVTDEEYVKFFCEQVLSQVEGKKWLSFDFYAMRNAYTYGEFTGTYVAAEWLRTVELMAKYASEYNAELHCYLQTCGFWKNNPRAEFSYTCHKSDEADLRFQAYTYMAYGVKAFTHFTYWTSPFYQDVNYDYSDSCISLDGEKNPLYYQAQTVNYELQGLADVYLSYDWKGTMPIIGSQNQTGVNDGFAMLEYSLDELKIVPTVTATQDTLIGQFYDQANGRDALIVVNYTDPEYGLIDTVDLTFDSDVTAVIIYRNGEYTEHKLTDNSINLQLVAGEGVFIIAMR